MLFSVRVLNVNRINQIVWAYCSGYYVMSFNELGKEKGIDERKFEILTDLLASLPDGLFTSCDELADYLRFAADGIESKDKYAMQA